MSLYTISSAKIILAGIPWIICGLVAAYCVIREEKTIDLPKLVMTFLIICGGCISLLVYISSTFKSFHFENPLYRDRNKIIENGAAHKGVK